MIIHWKPCYDHRPISRTQPEKDKIVIRYRGQIVAIDFSDSEIIEYKIERPALNFVNKAWREDGVLHLEVPSYGGLQWPKIIDHGEEELLTWRRDDRILQAER